MLLHATGFRQRFKVDRNQRRHQQDKGRVADIIQDPAALQRREFESALHVCLFHSFIQK